MTTTISTLNLYVIDYTVDGSHYEPSSERDRTTTVLAGSLRHALDIIECDYNAIHIHAVYTSDGKRLY